MENKLLPDIQRIVPLSTNSELLVILDRDGTLNFDLGYTHKLIDLSIIPTTISLLKQLKNHSAKKVCASNQAGIGYGFYTLQQLHKFNSKLQIALIEHGIIIDCFYSCTHLPNLNCDCRKPKSGLLDLAMSEYGTKKECSIFIGNNQSDSNAAKIVGIEYLDVNDSSVEEKWNDWINQWE